MNLQRYYRGKLALVVGASEGIGRAVAEALAAQQCNLILAARRLEPLEEARAAIAAGTTRETTVAVEPFDVADWNATRDAVDRVRTAHGVPDIVVNCAGFAHPGWLDGLDVALLEGMLRVNCLGTMHVCKAVLPGMVERGSGAIVNTSSLGGLIGLFGYTGYCASKYAVAGFSEALRREVAPFGVTVSLLCPPNTRTPGLERENRVKPPEVLAQEEKVQPIDAEVVARAVLRDVPRGRAVIIPTLDGRMAWYLARFAPWILDVILARPAQRK